MTEIELIDKCKAGDGEAFRKLLSIYKKQLYGYLYKLSSSKFFAEEMFQETLIKVWCGLKKYNNQSKFSSWLFTIAHNVAIDSLRKYKNKINTISIENVNESVLAISPNDQLIKKEMVELINIALDTLTDKQKHVFFLRQHGELSFAEISKITNEPINTVLSHMHYALKKIRKQLSSENAPIK